MTIPFGEQLRHYRERAGLTQEELAAKASLTAKAISALERGERRSPYPQTVRALADALGLSSVERAELLQARLGRKQTDVASQPTLPTPRSSPVGVLTEPKLPGYLTPFIGREQSRAELAGLLATPEHRLITLLGIGGIGKTRLAVEVAQHAQQFADGVTFVPLSPVGEPQAVVPAIAAARRPTAGAGAIVAVSGRLHPRGGHIRRRRRCHRSPRSFKNRWCGAQAIASSFTRSFGASGPRSWPPCPMPR